MDEEKNTISAAVVLEQHILFSQYLEREVIADVYLPVPFTNPELLNLMLINDGQDLRTMQFELILDKLIQNQEIEPMVCVGIHCGIDRKREYGTACSADYEGRGDKAGLYTKFIFDELLPFIRKTYQAPSFREKSFAGFSLGALSALDIVYNHADEFSKVGSFSGSFWWRRKSYEEGYNDETDRLMHLQVLKGKFFPWLKFFFECGELDETADRNNNGVIDTIDDTLDLIVELKARGYTDQHIGYLQLEDGEHNVATWARAFPDFLKWGWGNNKE